MKNRLLNITILFFAYFLPAKLGFLLALPPDGATAIWPASGIASAGIILLGYGALPGVFLGSIIANLHDTLSIAEMFSPAILPHLTKTGFIALGAMSESFAVAYIVKRFIGFPSNFSHWKDVLILFLLAGLVGSMPSPTISVTSFLAQGFITTESYAYTWFYWWIGNALGIITFTPILVTIFSPSSYISTRRKIYIIIPLITSLSLVSIVFINTNKTEQKTLQHELEIESRAASVSLENIIEQQLQQISSLKSFYKASNFIDRNEFGQFVEEIINNSDIIYAIEWVPYIEKHKLHSLLNLTIKDGIKNFQIYDYNENHVLKKSNYKSDSYFPILYSEPANKNKHRLGLNVLSDAKRRIDLDNSINNTGIYSSDIFEVTENDIAIKLFTIYQPIYKRGSINNTIDQRRKNIAGFVSTTYKVNSLIGHLEENLSAQGIKITVLDHKVNQSNADGSFVYKSPGEDNEEFLLTTSIGTPVIDRFWSITFHQTKEYIVTNKDWHLWYLLFAGLGFVAMSAILTMIITGYSDTIEKLVKQKASQLNKSETRFKLAVQGTKDGIWDWVDLSKDAQYWSPQFYQLLGYEYKEVDPTRSTFKTMIHPNDLEDMQRALDEHLLRDKAFDIEHRMKKKNGKYTWFQSRGALSTDSATGIQRMTGSLSDISDRKNTEKRLEKAKEEAEEATRLKSDFLATMSHEIRTPMNGVIGITELLLDTKLTTQQQGYLNNVLLSAENLLEILNDILDFSKIEAGQMELESVPFNLRTASQEVIELLLPKAQQKNLKINLDFNKNLHEHFTGDSVRVRQILHNLVGNAIKFTEKGSITISVTEQDSGSLPKGKTMMLVSVIDTGLGLTKEQRRTIFNKFVQADSTTTRKFGGTGLGLAICQMLVTMLGGEIGVDSEPGKGSTFSFTMLLDLASADSIVEKAVDNSVAEFQHDMNHPLRVMMAEDNRINAEFAKEMLEKLRCEVIVTKNGRDAFELLQEDREFDLIFMDCQMPIMDGFEATKKIREFSKKKSLSHIPIIALTANAMKGDRERCLDAGMDDYLSKPVRQKDFAAMIRKWIKIS